MSDVKRYTAIYPHEVTEGGDLVLASDYDAKCAEIDRLRIELRECQDTVKWLIDGRPSPTKGGK